ncbi:MAG: hypothetical protein RIS08_1053 [Actinomycetota bacterium]|jgi:predicted amidophosphoribosyltransferase
MLKILLQIIAPVRCACCEKNAVLCCDAHLWEPGVESIQGIPIHTAFPLDDLRVKAITAYKDRGVTALSKVFGLAARRLLDQLKPPTDSVIVIPPANKANYRKRGYHPVALIAKKLGFRVIAARTTKAVLDQRKLTASQRDQNLAGAFVLPPLRGKQVFVFDDVLTTGATVRELIRASRQAGAEVIAGCVLARRFSDFGAESPK